MLSTPWFHSVNFSLTLEFAGEALDHQIKPRSDDPEQDRSAGVKVERPPAQSPIQQTTEISGRGYECTERGQPTSRAVAEPSHSTHQTRETVGQQPLESLISHRGFSTKLTWTAIRTKTTAAIDIDLLSSTARSGAGSRLSMSSRRNSYRRGSQQSRAPTPSAPNDSQGTTSNLEQASETLNMLKKSGILKEEQPVPESSTGIKQFHSIPEIQTQSSPDESEKSLPEAPEFVQQHGEVSVPVAVSAACFIGETILCLGTSMGHVVCLPIPHLEPVCLLSETGPRITDSISLNLLLELAAPHQGAVGHVTPSEDAAMLVTADRDAVCLWDVADRTLALRCCMDQGQEVCRLRLLKSRMMHQKTVTRVNIDPNFEILYARKSIRLCRFISFDSKCRWRPTHLV